ncbi:tRNA dihydrouridine(16) synthase DusC [Leptospira levettii]|uniref:tRNA dihydrouridine synthase n=1 Tax=Leptospira levettii TaxID=2023178 RepID=UPI00108293EB|nr:tRNA-dihydrouridine synthase [Leptospira levettii]TGM69759.1 tRNA dihydrouridine(16) synthase DusC [Leptospira levettii]
MRILLAPMEGLLDFRLRDTLTRVGGYDECVSEFIRVNDTLLPSHRFYRYVPELYQNSRTKSGIPVKVQLLGSDINCMAENASKVASLGAYGIDINFGCPAPTVNRNRGGAALLKEPNLMYSIVKAVRNVVPKEIPVTAKMRLGYDTTEHALVCAKALEEGGAKEIVVHARTKVDGYKPPAYWEWISKITEHIKIPVIANGEIWNVTDAIRCQKISGCKDIMIGRGAVANPALALMIRSEKSQKLPWNEVKMILFAYWKNLESDMNLTSRAGRIKQWLHYLTRQYQEAENDFKSVKRFISGDEFTNYFESHIN